ncbi:hypothetical protein BGZ92_006250, partial [Podila epicladia]
ASKNVENIGSALILPLARHGLPPPATAAIAFDDVAAVNDGHRRHDHRHDRRRGHRRDHHHGHRRDRHHGHRRGG